LRGQSAVRRARREMARAAGHDAPAGCTQLMPRLTASPMTPSAAAREQERGADYEPHGRRAPPKPLSHDDRTANPGCEQADRHIHGDHASERSTTERDAVGRRLHHLRQIRAPRVALVADAGATLARAVDG
jgi:hypothetical protein